MNPPHFQGGASDVRGDSRGRGRFIESKSKPRVVQRVGGFFPLFHHIGQQNGYGVIALLHLYDPCWYSRQPVRLCVSVSKFYFFRDTPPDRQTYHPRCNPFDLSSLMSPPRILLSTHVSSGASLFRKLRIDRLLGPSMSLLYLQTVFIYVQHRGNPQRNFSPM